MVVHAVASARPAAMAPSATACALSAAAAAMEERVNPFRAFAIAVQPETSAVFTAARRFGRRLCFRRGGCRDGALN